jgi:hypothetical protein
MSAVTVGVVWDANSAKVTLTCTSGGKVFVFPFKLRAQGIYASDQLTATATNWSGGANPALYPHNELTYSNPYAGDSYFCADLATTILTRNTNPGKVKSVAFNANYSAALMVAALSLDIGDRITLAETQTALAEDYYINGVKMDYDALAKKLTCTWYLEIADWNDNAFRLDIDTLDGGKVLVF